MYCLGAVGPLALEGYRYMVQLEFADAQRRMAASTSFPSFVQPLVLESGDNDGGDNGLITQFDL